MRRLVRAISLAMIVLVLWVGVSFARVIDSRGALVLQARAPVTAGAVRRATEVMHAAHPSRSDVAKPSDAYMEWIFGRAAGGLVRDGGGHGYDAHICGNAQLVAGLNDGRVLSFDGSGSNSFWQGQPQDCGLSIEKPLDRSFDALSVEAWVRKDPGNWMPVIYRGKWDEESGFGLYMEWNAGKAVFGHYFYGADHKSGVQSEAVVQDGTWHQVVGVMEREAGGAHRYRIFVDGKLDAEQAGGAWAVAQAPAGTGKLMIACPNSSGAELPFKGELARISLFDVGLTPEMVKQRYEAQRPRELVH